MSAPSSWRVAAASVAGASHLASGTACQDAHQAKLIVLADEVVLIIAVSDGAGSAPSSEVGARIAVAAVVEQADAWFAEARPVKELSRATITEWFSGVREQIAERAAESSCDMRDFACTLLVAVIGEDHAAFAQLGDGAIVALTREKEWSWIFWPQHGPYANTTYFVTEDQAIERIEFEARPRSVNEIALFSDGLEQLVLDLRTRTTHDPFFNRMFLPLRESVATGIDTKLSEHLGAYLVSPAVVTRTSDDVTLVLASRIFDETGQRSPSRPEPANAGLDT